MQRKSVIKLVIFSIILIAIVSYIAVTRSTKKNDKMVKEAYVPKENNAPRVVVSDSAEVDTSRSKYDNKNRPRIVVSDDDLEDEADNDANKYNNTEVKVDFEQSPQTTTMLQPPEEVQ